MKILHTLAIVTLGLSFSSCASKQEIAETNATAQKWLVSQPGKARLNVSGNWYSESWGSIKLQQSGREISGIFGDYETKGVVSGDKVYLNTWNRGKAVHSIILSPSGKDGLSGSYCSTPAFSTNPEDQGRVELRREK